MPERQQYDKRIMMTDQEPDHDPVLNIDYSLCQGCGGCSDAYPQYFTFREERAWVINRVKFNSEDRDGILTICPYYAISIE